MADVTTEDLEAVKKGTAFLTGALIRSIHGGTSKNARFQLLTELDRMSKDRDGHELEMIRLTQEALDVTPQRD